MKIKIECECGNQETLIIEDGNIDHLNSFILWSNYDDDKVFLECDVCNEVVRITII